MFQVEVPVADDTALSDRMDAMRTWLNQRRFEPVTFRYTFSHNSILCRVEFPVEAEAVAFAIEFGGNIVGGSQTAI